MSFKRIGMFAAAALLLLSALATAGAYGAEEDAAPLVAALMQKKGWSQHSGSEVVADSLMRMAMRTPGLSAAEVLDRIDKGVAQFKTAKRVLNSGTVTGAYDNVDKILYMNANYFNEMTLCHEFLHVVSGDYEQAVAPQSVAVLPNFTYFDAAKKSAVVHLHEGLTQAFNLDMFEAVRKAQKFQFGKLTVTLRYEMKDLNMYAVPVALTLPFIYAAGSEDIRAAYLGDGAGFLRYEAGFDARYGQGRLRELTVLIAGLSTGTSGLSRLSSAQKTALYKNYQTYTDTLIEMLEYRRQAIRTDAEMEAFQDDLEQFAIYMPAFSDKRAAEAYAARLKELG